MYGSEERGLATTVLADETDSLPRDDMSTSRFDNRIRPDRERQTLQLHQGRHAAITVSSNASRKTEIYTHFFIVKSREALLSNHAKHVKSREAYLLELLELKTSVLQVGMCHHVVAQLHNLQMI